MNSEINQKYEDAPVIPISTRAEKILSEIKIVNEARKVANIRITCPVLGAGEHDEENYKLRLTMKEKLEALGHSPFFLEEISAEETKSFLVANGISKTVVDALIENTETKNDAILRCSPIIFAIATNEGTLIEIAKCCNTANESKLRILVPKDRYHELSQASLTFGELNRIHKNVYTFENMDEAKKHIEAITNKEICHQLRVNGSL